MTEDIENSFVDGLFFIVGTGRCGTTLLQAMLNSSSRIAIPPETRFFGQSDPKAGGFHDPLQDAEVEPYIEARRADWWWRELGLVVDEFAQAVRGGVRTSRSIYLWMLQRLTSSSGKLRIGEKTPYYGNWAEHLLGMFPRARFIHLHRDPRDVVASLRSQEWWIAKSALSCAMVCGAALDRQAQLRRKWNEDRLLTVGYEALVAHPERELERICRFLNEPFESSMLRFHERADPGFLDLERDWKNLTLQALTNARIERYRRELSDREIRLVEWTLGPLMTDLGYERDSTASDNPRWNSEFEAEVEHWEQRHRESGPERCVDVEPILHSIKT